MSIVRRLLPEDHALCREVRLRALATDPQVFSSNLALETAYPEAHWRERLADPSVGVFGVFEGPAIVGMCGVIQRADDPTTGTLWGSWLDPAVRGRGLSRAMYAARIDWARAKGLTRLLVSHRRSNIRSMRANQRFGFLPTHVTPHTWPDGTVEDQLHYALTL